LVQTLKMLGLPLVLWNRRYFDTRFAFTPARARCSAERLRAGDVVLLHDGNSKAPAHLIEAVRMLVARWGSRGSFGVLH
jgi:hypothetical protein